ncbi:helix-turn-helix transcriptional regulator, partial [Cellulomonas endophytica]|uniref:helix-turn-helix transcriptional regulator n=1 Tax=Cellulomonas endophytica TaxID=2494735 RepID=UPI0013E90A44
AAAALAAGPGRRRGPVVWALAGRAARPFPLGAFAGLRAGPRAGPAATALGPTPAEPSDAPGEPSDAPSAVDRVLGDVVARGAGLLVVDDAHLLDELSALVVHRAVVRGALPVVVTLRSDEPAPDAVTALWKDDLLPRWDLAPLDRAATVRLVTEVLGGPVESRTGQRLWALTEGVPLYLRHLLAGEVAAGRLGPAGGLWSWAGDPHLTPGLVALLEREVGALEEPVRDVLDLVTLAEPLALDALLHLATPAAAEEAERRGLVVAAEDGDGARVRLGHPLYGEVRRAAMGEVRARRLRGLLVDAPGAAPDALRRAVLALGSDRDPGPDLLLAGAREALDLHDLPTAERLARAAARSGRWDARLLHAGTLSWLTRGEEAEAVLRDLEPVVPEGRPRALVRGHRAGNLLWTLRRADAAQAVLAEALHQQPPGTGRVLLEALGAAVAAALGDAPGALARGRALLTRDLADDDLALVLVLAAVAAGAAVTGRTDLLDEVARGRHAPRSPDAVPVFGLADWVLLGYRLAGDPAAGDAATRRLRRSSADLPGPARAMGLVLDGHAALAAGRVREALVPLREGWALLGPSRHEFRFRCRPLLATAHALAGEAGIARALLVGADEDRHPAYVLDAPDDALALAWVAAAEGSSTQAVRLAEDAADLARRQRSPAFEVLARQTAVQLGGAAAALPRLGVLTGEVGGVRAGLARDHARAAADEDADGLLAAAAAWEAAGDLVAAGDAAAQAAT